MLYDPDIFAMVGLSSPMQRQGLGVCLQRNRRSFLLAEVGKEVDAGGGVPLVLTSAMVDEGLDEVTALLDNTSEGNHFAIEGLTG